MVPLLPLSFFYFFWDIVVFFETLTFYFFDIFDLGVYKKWPQKSKLKQMKDMICEIFFEDVLKIEKNILGSENNISGYFWENKFTKPT